MLREIAVTPANEQPRRLPPRDTVRRDVLIVAAGALLLVILGVFWVRNALSVYQADLMTWRDEHAPALIVGKTAHEIISKYGRPYALERDPDGKPQLILYKDVRHGQYCGIALEKGVAVRVSLEGQ